MAHQDGPLTRTSELIRGFPTIVNIMPPESTAQHVIGATRWPGRSGTFGFAAGLTATDSAPIKVVGCCPQSPGYIITIGANHVPVTTAMVGPHDQRASATSLAATP
jgi:hypothetical protein